MSVWLKNREHSGAHDPARSIIETLALHGEHSGAGSGSEAWASGPSLRRVSPVDLQPLGVVRSASAEDCSRAIEQATTAFKVWRMVPAPRRGEVVRQIGEMLRRHKKELAEIISLEVGKIRAEAEGEVQEMIDMADFAVGQSRMLYGATMPSERPGHRIYEQWHPLRPVGSDHRLQFPGGGLFRHWDLCGALHRGGSRRHADRPGRNICPDSILDQVPHPGGGRGPSQCGVSRSFLGHFHQPSAGGGSIPERVWKRLRDRQRQHRHLRAEIGGAFGGEKDTGGGREAGSDAWKAYMRRQTVTVNWSGKLPLAQGIEFKSV